MSNETLERAARDADPALLRRPVNRVTAVRRLTNRYNEQCERFPLTRELGLELYVRANLRGVMAHGLLAMYDEEV